MFCPLMLGKILNERGVNYLLYVYIVAQIF